MPGWVPLSKQSLQLHCKHTNTHEHLPWLNALPFCSWNRFFSKFAVSSYSLHSHAGIRCFFHATAYDSIIWIGDDTMPMRLYSNAQTSYFKYWVDKVRRTLCYNFTCRKNCSKKFAMISFFMATEFSRFTTHLTSIQIDFRSLFLFTLECRIVRIWREDDPILRIEGAHHINHYVWNIWCECKCECVRALSNVLMLKSSNRWPIRCFAFRFYLYNLNWFNAISSKFCCCFLRLCSSLHIALHQHRTWHEACFTHLSNMRMRKRKKNGKQTHQPHQIKSTKNIYFDRNFAFCKVFLYSSFFGTVSFVFIEI